MKVICIDGKANKTSFNLPEMVPLNATQSSLFPLSYIIEGYEIDPTDGFSVHWRKRRFIPCSNIDETEMEREYSLIKQPS